MKFEYDGGNVNRSKLEEAIDLFIELEPDPEGNVSMEDYKDSLEKRDQEVKLAECAIKNYAEQFQSKSLKSMQREFYCIIDSDKYTQCSSLDRSVAFGLLEYLWSGIGEWQQ
jgi:hypothetical protein